MLVASSLPLSPRDLLNPPPERTPSKTPARSRNSLKHLEGVALLAWSHVETHGVGTPAGRMLRLLGLLRAWHLPPGVSCRRSDIRWGSRRACSGGPAARTRGQAIRCCSCRPAAYECVGLSGDSLCDMDMQNDLGPGPAPAVVKPAQAHPTATHPLPSLPRVSVSLSAVLPALLPAAQVNSLTSFETDIPFEYYRMPFCKPPEGIHRAGNAANLGTAIMGIKLENSQYNFTVMVRVLTWGWAPAAGSHGQAGCV